jgi:hypothetical protein
MERSTLHTAATIFTTVLASCSLGIAQTSNYDATSLNGSYAYTISGSAIDPYTGRSTEIAETGRLTADGAGNVSGSSTVVISGSLVRRTFTGTYALNTDGTGSLLLNPSWGPPIHADLVAGEHGRLLKLVLTDSGSTLSGAMESQQAPTQTPPPQGYDAGALHGDYEYQIAGTAADFWGNVSLIREIGLLSADGAGALTGTSTVTINGSVVRRSLSGNYTMNADGSGSAVLYPTWGPLIHVDLFLSANGLKTNFVVTDSGSTLSGVLTARTLSAPAAPAQ